MANCNLAEEQDIWLDEQTSLTVTMRVSTPEGVSLDLTEASVTWVATFNGVQQIKKTTGNMLVALSAQLETAVAAVTCAGATEVIVSKVEDFPADAYGRVVADLAAGDNIKLTNDYAEYEYRTITAVDKNTKCITLETALDYIYSPPYADMTSGTIKRGISSFQFELLPGDTILPATKSYGTPIIWQHMALIAWESSLSPGNIYQAPTTLVGARGRMFISPILDTS